ncbi:hypothetical protein VTO42DRAFT_2190 [Malbranchea cinnamomea]
MAAVTQPRSPPTRQPFAVLGDARLRAVESIKNRQNGFSSKSLKRSYDASNLSDSENVDPQSAASPTKRHKNWLGHACCKPMGGVGLVAKPKVIATPAKRVTAVPPSSCPASRSSPKSTPLRAPAGRSLKSKAAKVFYCSVGRTSQMNPLPFAKRHAPRAPFSVAEALSGPSRAFRSKSTGLTPAAGLQYRKSWNFEIYVDSEQEEMANLMEHSTSILDIGDDEDKASSKDDRGKENIPPNELSNGMTSDNIDTLPAPTNPSRHTDMSDESREPLGELNPGDFVPEGLDAPNPIPVSEDEPAGHPPRKTSSPLSITETSTVDELARAEQAQLPVPEVINVGIDNSTPSANSDASAHSINLVISSKFEIWESGSATEEAFSS